VRIPEKTEFPLRARPQKWVVDDIQIEKFHKALRWNTSILPPTIYSIFLSGVFEIVNDLKVDWKNLLHATQAFEYGEPLSVPTEGTAETVLKDVKFRAKTYWMQFETVATANASRAVVVRSKTLLLVKAESEMP